MKKHYCALLIYSALFSMQTVGLDFLGSVAQEIIKVERVVNKIEQWKNIVPMPSTQTKAKENANVSTNEEKGVIILCQGPILSGSNKMDDLHDCKRIYYKHDEGGMMVEDPQRSLKRSAEAGHDEDASGTVKLINFKF